MRNLSLLALLFMLAPTAAAQSGHPRWSVLVSSGKGKSYIDEASCHPLEYFLGNPLTFDYGSDLFGKKPDEIKDKVHSVLIGEIAGYAVLQVTHDVNDGELLMKMILIERKANQLCEIYQQQHEAAMVAVEPAYLVRVGGETLLATTDPVSGNGAWREEQYWAFDKDGPINLNVRDRITELQKKLLPKGATVMNGGGFEVQTLEYSMPVWKEGDAHCCPTGGTIKIRFALKDHRLTVASQSFAAN